MGVDKREHNSWRDDTDETSPSEMQGISGRVAGFRWSLPRRTLYQEPFPVNVELGIHYDQGKMFVDPVMNRN